MNSNAQTATSLRYGSARAIARPAVSSLAGRRNDRRDYRFLMLVSVGLFLCVSLLTRLLPRSLRPLAGPKGCSESCLAEAKRAAYAVVPYAFEW